MRELDRALTSPHRVAIFEGGHVWLSSELALEAVEWMELQAMATGRMPRDQPWIDERYKARLTAAQQLAGAPAVQAFSSLAADFAALKDVAEISAKAAALRKDKSVRDSLKRDKAEEDGERQKISELLQLERQLADRELRSTALGQLRDQWKRLAADSALPAESPTRRIARRVTRGLAMSAQERTADPEYLELVATFRPGRRP